MKNILIVTLICLSIVIVGCGITNTNDLFAESDIEDIANRYFNAVLMGEFELAKSCIHPESPLRDSVDLTFQQLSSAIGEINSYGCSFTANIEFSGISITGETAIGTVDNLYVCVWCSLYDNGCQHNYNDKGMKILFKKYNGKWLVY